MTYALEQLADVAPRFKENPSLLEPSGGEDYLLRVPHRNGESLLWEDASMDLPPLDAPPIEVEMEASKLEALGRLPRTEARLEVDFFMLPTPVHDEGDRPYLPHMLLVIEAASGMIFGHDLLSPNPSPEAMWGRIPEMFADRLSEVDLAPEKISVDSELLFGLLEPLAEEAGIGIDLTQSLPALDQARDDLLQAFGE